MDLRKMCREDASPVARLSDQLGYPSSADEVLERFDALTREPEQLVLLAEEGGAVIGWIHVLVVHTLEVDTKAEVMGLVVDDKHRGRGVGSALMEQTEIWARERGCATIRLRSNVIRREAHRFYERRGYKVLKTQLAFEKQLAGESKG